MGSHGGITRLDALPSLGGLRVCQLYERRLTFWQPSKNRSLLQACSLLSDNSFNWVHSSDEQGMEGKATLLKNQIDPTF